MANGANGVGAEIRAWVQTIVTVATGVVGVVVALGLNESVRDALRPKPLEFVTGAEWRVAESVPNDKKWYSEAFDDSKWLSAQIRDPAIRLTDTRTAPRIWASPNAESCYIRYEFHLSRDEIGKYRTAVFLASVDDEYNIYLNGQRLGVPRADGADVTALDIYPWLRPKENVIGLQVWNRGGVGRGVAATLTLK